MARFRFRKFIRQTVALSHKNFLVLVARNPIGFLFWTYALPLALLAVMASIPGWLTPSTVMYGVASPTPIQDISIAHSKKLVIVKKPSLGSDIDRVIDTFTKGIDPSVVYRVNSSDALNSLLHFEYSWYKRLSGSHHFL